MSKIFNDLNLCGNEIQNVIVENLSSNPDPSLARIYYNTVTNKLMIYDGSNWVDFAFVTSAVTYKVVETLPTIGEENMLYLVLVDPYSDDNKYNEFAYINGYWENLSKVELDDYATQDWVVEYFEDQFLWENLTGRPTIYLNGDDVTANPTIAIIDATSQWFGTQAQYNDLVAANQIDTGVAYIILPQVDWNCTDAKSLSYIQNKPLLLDVDTQIISGTDNILKFNKS